MNALYCLSLGMFIMAASARHKDHSDMFWYFYYAAGVIAAVGGNYVT